MSQDGVGKGGDIFVTTGTLRLSNSSVLTTIGAGQGDAGNIVVNAGTLQLTNGSTLTTIGAGQGDAGNIVVNARDTVSLDSNSFVGTPISSFDGSTTKGQSGDIEINARSLFLTNGGVLSSGTNGQGNAGNIDIRASDSVVIDEGSNNRFTSINSAVLPNGVGRGGDIQITTGSLSLANNASLLAGTYGQGDAGNVIINARDRVSFNSNARLFTSTGGQGNAGNVTIRTGDFSIDGVSQDGKSSSAISSNVEQTGVGRAGNIDIVADSLAVTNGGVITATTEGQGKAGNITIKAGSRVSLAGTSPNGIRSAIATETTNTSKEDAGNLTIATKRLSISDGAIISAATLGQGRAGDITINASDSISLSGLSPDNQYRSAITTETTNSATGNAGNLNIATSLFDIRDGAGIFAASFGQGTAGDVTVQADSLRLNRGYISTQTASTNGGNITLKLDDTLILRNNSFISTTAGTAQAGGDGGNITILNSPFIIALPNENSDITANAFTGRGGNINISTKGIFGIQKRAEESPQTNDITASSAQNVQGQIDITEPNVQPTQGLVELPASVLDASNQIAQTCPSGANAKRPLGEFVVTGRGGSLPPNPLEPLAGSTSLSQLASIDGETQVNQPSQTPNEPASTTTPTTIVEAQGWIKTKDGKIALVAFAPQATPSAPPTASACPQPNQK